MGDITKKGCSSPKSPLKVNSSSTLLDSSSPTPISVPRMISVQALVVEQSWSSLHPTLRIKATNVLKLATGRAWAS
ncbi:hypothetical protein Tco_0713372 [Tanacetum coccineum]